MSDLPRSVRASSVDASRRMAAVRQRDTAPELALRRILHARGFRYRVDAQPAKAIRRKADLLFPRDRVAVFVDGCFWHCCPIHGSRPKSNAAWWNEKLDSNARRDRDTDERLAADGWTVVRVWEHEDAKEAATRVAAVIADRRRQSPVGRKSRQDSGSAS